MKNKKTTINFTIDVDLKSEFIELSDECGINRSKTISNYIKKWCEENNKSINNLKNDKR